ncbi:MAG: CAP domain-containing protein [Anaerolineales bacterium]
MDKRLRLSILVLTVALLLGLCEGVLITISPLPPFAPSITPAARTVPPPASPPGPAPGTATAIRALTPLPSPTSLAGDFVEQVVGLVNARRVEAGCPPLSPDPLLRAAAQGHSEDMARYDFFDHTGSDGRSAGDRLVSVGYAYALYGENLAGGSSSPEEVVADWMGSPGHRANLLNCDFEEVGVGYYYLQEDPGDENLHHYWTLLLAAPLR